MHWTNKKPDRDGWWWYQEPLDELPEVVEVDKDIFWSISGGCRDIHSVQGKWSSEPIQEPREKDDEDSIQRA